MKHIDLHIQADQPLSRIAPEIYGHFSEHLGTCMYGGIYVGADSRFRISTVSARM